MNRAIQLSRYGQHLWTRDKAKEIRKEVFQQLDEMGAGETLVLDLDGVEVFDYSFANELFGKTMLALGREFPGRFVVVENLTEYTSENLARALESLSLVAITRKKLKYELIGKVHPKDHETFGVIVKSKEALTAGELSRQMDVNITAMNERLTKLATLGLVRRTKSASPAGREQFAYSALR